MNASPVERPSLIGKITRTFLAGLLAVLPLALTVTVIVWLADFVHRLLGPSSFAGQLLESIGLRFVTSENVAYAIGIGVSLASIYLLGALVEAGMKNRWHAVVDSVVDRLPLVRNVYQTLSKLTKMFERSDQSDLQAMSAVLCHFGGAGGSSVLALMPNAERIRMNGRDYHAVLIPTAPVPYGGALLFVPVEWIEPADIALDGLFNIYMSMGATSPDYLQTRAAPGAQEKRRGQEPEPPGP